MTGSQGIPTAQVASNSAFVAGESGFQFAVDLRIVKFEIKLNARVIVVMAALAAIFAAIQQTNSWGLVGAFVVANVGPILAAMALITLIGGLVWYNVQHMKHQHKIDEQKLQAKTPDLSEATEDFHDAVKKYQAGVLQQQAAVLRGQTQNGSNTSSSSSSVIADTTTAGSSANNSGNN